MPEVVVIDNLTELPGGVTMSYPGYTVEEALERFEDVTDEVDVDVVFEYTCKCHGVTTIYIPVENDLGYENLITMGRAE